MLRKSNQPIVGEALENRRLFSAGAVDTTFGTNGIANPITTGSADAVFVQSDGKTVVAGTSGANVPYGTVARYNLDGTLDLTFGANHNGKVYLQAGEGDLPCVVRAVTEQSDGSILIAVETNINDGSDVAVVRLTPQGLPDKTFNGNGTVNIDIGDYDVPNSIIVDYTGKILIAGEVTNVPFLGKTTQDGFILRLNSNGSLDKTFNGSGKLTVSAPEYFQSIAIDQTGNSSSNPFYNTIVAAGTNESSVMVYRFKTNGSLATSFDSDGYASVSLAGDNWVKVSGIYLQSSGRIVVSGDSGIRNASADTYTSDPVLVRFLPNGPLDGSFGSGGWVKTKLGPAFNDSLAMKENLSGNLLVLVHQGETDGLGNGGFEEVLSYSANGVLDHAFGASGIAKLPGASLWADLAVGAGRRITVVGGPGEYRAVRLLDEGADLAEIYDLSPTVSEAGATSTHILVTFSERLPVATRINLGFSGSASSPLTMLRTFIDYHTDDVVYASILGSPTSYVTIPAGQTYVDITLTANDDKRIEGTEQAIISVLPGPGYDIGTPSSVSIDIRDNDSITVAPTADAYVKDGSSTNNNYGTSKTLLVQKSSTVNQIAYLKFDLSSIATINFAQFRLFGGLVGGASNLAVGIFGVSNTTWTETGIKNSNKPAINSTAIVSATMPDAISRWYYFDLTSYLQAQKAAGHNIVTLAVEMTSSSSTYAQFNSREGNVVDTRPQLVLG